MNAEALSIFDRPDRRHHIATAALEVLAIHCTNEQQLSILTETIDRAARAHVQVKPPAKPPSEITPACLRFYERTANSGIAEQIVKLATISSYFRERFPRAVAIAKSQLEKRSQIENPQVLNST